MTIDLCSVNSELKVSSAYITVPLEVKQKLILRIQQLCCIPWYWYTPVLDLEGSPFKKLLVDWKCKACLAWKTKLKLYKSRGLHVITRILCRAMALDAMHFESPCWRASWQGLWMRKLTQTRRGWRRLCLRNIFPREHLTQSSASQPLQPRCRKCALLGCHSLVHPLQNLTRRSSTLTHPDFNAEKHHQYVDTDLLPDQELSWNKEPQI